MAFFRYFLMENDQTPDTTFAERDESALVWFLLLARSRGSTTGLTLPADFEPPERIRFTDELKFIAGFLCFFVSKPIGYLREMRAFREYFIPGFADDVPKQIQLGQALREGFYTATLDDLAVSETLDRFFDVAEIGVAAGGV